MATTHSSTGALPAAGELNKRVERMERLANLMDSKFRIPGFNLRFGWDSILGLIPGVGDAATMIPGVLMIYEARRLGIRNPVLFRMCINSGIDFVLGSIPVFGDVFDLFFKSHRKNLSLLKRELERIQPRLRGD